MKSTKYPENTFEQCVETISFFEQVHQEAGPTMAATSENLNYASAVLKSKFSYSAKRHLKRMPMGISRLMAALSSRLTGRLLRIKHMHTRAWAIFNLAMDGNTEDEG